MKISTTTRHCELEPEVRAFCAQRLERFERFARDLHEAHLVVTLEKYRYQVELTVRLNQRELVSHAQATDARSAVEGAAQQLEEQLRRLKERRVDRRRAGSAGQAPGEADRRLPGASQSGPAEADSTDDGGDPLAAEG